MADETKLRFAQALRDIMNEKPLDKITVREIADDCGINRNTFYYHYHDIFDLLEKMFAKEEERLLSEIQDVTTLQQGFMQATHFAMENYQAIYHAYNSVSRDSLTRYLYNAASISMRKYILGQCDKDNMPSDRDLEDLIFLFASMIEGAIINVMREGLTRDVENLIDNAIRLMEGTVRLAIDNCNS